MFSVSYVLYTLDVDAEYVREMVYMLVDDLYIKRDRKGHVEQRIEDLETRVTEQSLQYQVPGTDYKVIIYRTVER